MSQHDHYKDKVCTRFLHKHCVYICVCVCTCIFASVCVYMHVYISGHVTGVTKPNTRNKLRGRTYDRICHKKEAIINK